MGERASEIALDVVESLLEGCQVIGFDFRYLYINEAACAQARKAPEELLGRTMMECYPGIDETAMFAELRECMAERTHSRMENEFVYPDGSVATFELRFVPVPEGVCVLSLDISEQKRSARELAKLEQQLRQAQKLEAVGRLAGGVAHDFNNLLSVILSYSGLLLDDLSEGQTMHAEIEEIDRAGQRARQLTRQLLAFSRQRVAEPRVIDPAQVISGMHGMLTRLLGAGVELAVLSRAPVGTIRVDPGSVEQVLLNLVVNARDAMPEGGKLTVETRNVDLDAGYADTHFDVKPGRYVMIAVTDAGEGMDAETQSRMFEPFFTTKDVSKGTGLGLSTVYGLVKQNGGHIWVYSEVGSGTTFKIYFPRVDAGVHHESSQPPASTRNGNETILLVEDDDQVRGAACAILRRSGYRVLEAANGGEALLASETHAANIHLLLTDVVLPRMNGRDLATRLAVVRPEMKVLYMSGYSEDAVMQHGILESDVAYLQKPLTPDGILCRVREVLDS